MGYFNQVKEGLHQQPMEKKYKGYQIGDDNCLLYNNRLYVPKSLELRHLIMDEFHRRPYVGHPSYQKMVKKTRQLYY
jgi:hypothetical protein